MSTAIDLFAGVGGFGEGARKAKVHVVWAGNHWKEACDAYELNHGLKPACENLHRVDWSAVPAHDIMLASPSCQGFTKARGKHKRRHDLARATAGAVVDCLEIHRPAVAIVENVPEFLEWERFNAWQRDCESIGYAVSPHIIDAADHGVPQNRVRAFCLLTQSKHPLVLKLPRRELVSAQQILTDDAVRIWSPVASMCETTRARVAAGRRRHGRRHLTVYYGSNEVGRSVHRPLGTLTTLDRFAVVDGRYMGFLTVNECRAAMGFPKSYRLPENKRLAKHLLGNAVPPPVVTDILNALRRAA